MPIENNIEQLEKFIEGIGDYYESEVPVDLNKLTKEIKDDLKNGRYKNESGDLRRSVQAKLIDYNIDIKMLNYGYFVSFGVQGGKYRALGLPDEVAAAFGTNKFTSKKRKNWGIRPRNFYPDDIEEQIIDILTQE